MLKSLRVTMALLWFFVAIVCAALAFQLHGLSELGIGGEIAKVQDNVKLAAQSVQQEFVLYLSSFSEPPSNFDDPERRRELLLLLDLSLGHYYGTEGGFWSPQSKFLAYSFPTHEPVKRDVPEAESSRITSLNQRAMADQKELNARFDSSGEVLLLQAIPVRSNLVIWTMSRAHVAGAAAFERLGLGFVFLLLLILAAGGYLLYYLHNWGRHLISMEDHLVASRPHLRLAKTGLPELDRLVTAFNRQNENLQASQERSHQLSIQLTRAERLAALGRMSAGLAHEIRNPLGAMRLQIENALARTIEENQQRPYHKILNEISRLDDLLERLLAVVRLDKLTISLTPMGRLLEDCANRYRGGDTCGRIEVETDLVEWPIDEPQLARALDNLLGNALRHTPKNGWVRISAERRENDCLLAVEDSGPGIPKDLRGKIFEPFVSFRSNGTGLGLALVREIVEAHGGTIVCTQGTIGARFEMRLPWRES
ncbi:MAG: hypothetical protein QOE88_76 [Verrucomicrobiota bacterium]|nr:hypothetical protein [Verrucomicrobiota bacterium]